MNKDVIVIGGGVVGLSAALAMHQRGFSVALLDAGSLTVSPSQISPRVYAINHASQRLLQQFNVWPLLDSSRISPYQHIHVWSAAKGGHIDFDSRMIAADRLGSIIDEANLRHALLQQIAAHDIALFPETKVTLIHELPDGIEIGALKQRWHAKLMIIADGASSSTRDLLHIPLTTWSYRQHALVATIQTEKSHQQTAFQIFSSDGALAFLPLSDEHQCSIVWSSSPTSIQERMLLPEEAFNLQLAAAFEEKLGKLNIMTQRYQFPLHMRHVKQYKGAHWLIMGDAAHTIHPLAGLGLNVGLADLNAWLNLLGHEKSKLCSSKALGAYHRQRQHAVWQTIALMEGLKATFLNQCPPIAMLRKLGLDLCNQVPPLKRLFIEHAAG